MAPLATIEHLCVYQHWCENIGTNIYRVMQRNSSMFEFSLLTYAQ